MNTDRDRSYRNRVERSQIVILNRDVVGVVWDQSTPDWKVIDRPVAPLGAEVIVLSESNAGFRGIEFSFEYEGRRHWHNITTAAIRKGKVA